MKKPLINILRSFAPLLPLQRLIPLTRQRLFLPFYHAIQGGAVLPHIHHLYTLRTAAQFEKDLEYLMRYFKPITLQNVHDVVAGKKNLAAPAFHLTFDDGLREVFEIAAPILKRKGIPATVFLNAAFVDNRDLFFRYKVSLLLDAIKTEGLSKNQIVEIRQLLAVGKSALTQKLLSLKYQDTLLIDQLTQIMKLDIMGFLQKQKPYLTTAQIRSLQTDGFTFGAHSVDHPQYDQIPLSSQIDQTEKSVRFVQQHFQPALNCFSFPFTDDGVSQSFFNQINKNQVTQLTFGCAGLKHDSAPNHLQRFPMEGTNQPAANLIKAEYAYYLVKALFNKNQIIRS